MSTLDGTVLDLHIHENKMDANRPTLSQLSVAHDRKHYPNVNQGPYCWQLYNEFVLCEQKTGANCSVARYRAEVMCPAEWIESWDDQRSAGTFLGVSDKAAH